MAQDAPLLFYHIHAGVALGRLTNYEISDYLHKSELDASILKHRLIGYLRAFNNLEELAKQRDAYKRILKQKDKILSVVSHELRGPLNNMSGLLEIFAMDEDTLNKEHQEYLQILQACTNGMIYQVRDLLDSSAFERGSLQINRQHQQANTFFEKLLPVLHLQYRLTSKEKPIEFRTEISPALPNIYIDENRLNQVIVNLITNAFKYTPSGEVKISAKINPEGDKIIIRISDTGIGMSSEQINVLFDDYTQAARGNTYTKGIGMGLSIVKTLIDLQEGSIYVTSRPGQGSTFTLEFKAFTRL